MEYEKAIPEEYENMTSGDIYEKYKEKYDLPARLPSGRNGGKIYLIEIIENLKKKSKSKKKDEGEETIDG